MTKRKRPAAPPIPPPIEIIRYCEVHEGRAMADELILWNGQRRWTCRTCREGR